jgi:hypothetical protein
VGTRWWWVPASEVEHRVVPAALLEVDDPRDPVVRDQDVVGSEVAMHQSGVVEGEVRAVCVQHGEALFHRLDRFRPVCRSAVKVGASVEQVEHDR